MKVLAILPAYNEARTIAGLVDGLRRHLPDAGILVINDGSSDGTSELLRTMDGIDYLEMPFNLGIGGAVLAGMLYFLEGGYDILVRLDGDGQHPPEYALGLVQTVAGGHDMVIGSRYLEPNGEYSSVVRMMGIKMLSGISRFVLGRRFSDNTSGYRAFSRRAVEYLVTDYPYDFPEPEEIYILQKGKFDIVEIPVRMQAREAGVTSINLLKTWYFLVKIVLTISIKYMIGGKR